jgi:adenine-specific DNA-methyltransferase
MSLFDMQSPDGSQRNIALIRQLFPQCVTEAYDDNGSVTYKVDFDLLRQELAGVIVEGPTERYQLNWPGKREAILTANAPTRKTLRPQPDQSVNFDTTRNLFVEGDNLEVLKLLQESYLGKVKLIYIDPPYNTGNDFIYKDDFAQDIKEYLHNSGQHDDQGRRLVANTESNGRFHSDWLNMMYARLKLARNLLREDGVIFVSIDDNEIFNVSKVLVEIFGETNFVAQIAWQNMDTVKNDAKHFSSNHENVLCYAKNIDHLNLAGIRKTDKQRAYYRNRDNDSRGDYLLTPLHAKSGSENMRFPYTFSNGQTWSPPDGTFWRFSNNSLKRLDEEGRLFLDPQGINVPQKKTYWSEVGDRMPPVTFWDYEMAGSTRQSNNELASLVGKGVFPNPKPTKLISLIIDLFEDTKMVILDFFAGSATTAHAMFLQNLQDSGNRQFILVQYPEPLNPANSSQKDAVDFCDKNNLPRTIAEISKERIRRAGNAVLSDWYAKNTQLSFDANITSSPRDGTGRDGTGRDGTGRDGTGRDGTGRDGTGRDGTGRDGTGAHHPTLVFACLRSTAQRCTTSIMRLTSWIKGSWHSWQTTSKPTAPAPTCSSMCCSIGVSSCTCRLPHNASALIPSILSIATPWWPASTTASTSSWCAS